MKRNAIYIILALFLLSVIGSGTSRATGNTYTLTGEVISVFPDSGQMIVKNSAGKTISLTVGPKVDLKPSQIGHLVTLEHDDQGTILSLAVDTGKK